MSRYHSTDEKSTKDEILFNMTTAPRVISVIGTVGLPAKYGGFETLTENLVQHSEHLHYSVYCSKKQYAEHPSHWQGNELVYLPLEANGVQSIPYDILSMMHAVFVRRSKTLLVLGVSGAIMLPFIRLFSTARIITNIDGLEWRREKWNKLASAFLKFSERLAVRFSHVVISDNQAIADYVCREYTVPSEVIAYGGDHVTKLIAKPDNNIELPDAYLFCVCRIEKENNIHTILEAFKNRTHIELVLVGNWSNSRYGSDLLDEYADQPGLNLFQPIYDVGVLRWMRESSAGFVHGHSAGGTNPALVEAMWFGKPIVAFDCSYNRHTTRDLASYFKTTDELIAVLENYETQTGNLMGEQLLAIAQTEYTWRIITDQYVRLFEHTAIS